MKKNGFIATSLIYSFFLVFLAIIAALLNRYIANKTIAERFNEEVEESLNTETYTLTIYSKNSNIKNGMTLTNLISNGNFEGLNFWSTNDNLDATYVSEMWLDNYSVRKDNYSTSGAYIYQNVHVLNNSTYYFSIDYSHDVDIPLSTYIDYTPNTAITTSNNLGDTWTKASQSFTSPIDANLPFVVGNSSSVYTGTSYFTHAMVLNLTASFGNGYEPDRSWVDNNIKWFDGTISYLRLDGLESGETVDVIFNPYTNYTKSTIACEGDTNEPLSPNNMELETIDNRLYGTFTIDEVKSNISCTIDWSEETI